MKLATASLCLLLCLSGPALSDPAPEYRLGPGDHVQIRVSDFRSGLGEAYQWPMFSQQNEEFIVGPDGRISVPVAGAIDAAGRKTADVESDISSRLQTRAGLTSRPDTSVQIVKFRPFYVSGVVDKPGEYEFRPGLTVLQAVSIAGGLQRLSTDLLLGLQKDALNARGDLRVLTADRISLLARQARIDAEAAGRDTIEFPAELTSVADSEANRAMQEEQILFESHKTGLKKQVAALEQNKKFLASEIDQLKQKNASISKGRDATQQEYDLIAGLVKRGLTAAPRQLELEQNLTQIQGNQLDAEVAVVRANEDIARSDRDIAELQAKFRNDVIVEAQDVRVKLSETVQKIETARQMVRQAETQAPALLEADRSAAAHPTYLISRAGADGRMEEVAARDADFVLPGDVVRVVVKPESVSATGASN